MVTWWPFSHKGYTGDTVPPCPLRLFLLRSALPLSAPLPPSPAPFSPSLSFPSSPWPVVVPMKLPEACPGLGDFPQVPKRPRAPLAEASPPQRQWGSDISVTTCVTLTSRCFPRPQRSLNRDSSRYGSPRGSGLVLTRTEVKQGPVLDGRLVWKPWWLGGLFC